jgi:ATP-dependent Clp protease ATP-binding subunit ClpB
MKMAEEHAEPSEIRAQIEETLHHQFKPEFLNRIDETIIFRSLSKESMLNIVDIQLARLNARLKERKISLHIRQSAKQLLVDIGYDPVFGARPLKRAIQHYLENPLAMEILEARFTENDHILVEGKGSGFVFSRQQKS